MNYTNNDLITIAKRDNNTKRQFLLVNPLQGKHLHVSPKKSLALFKTLAEKVFSSDRKQYDHTLIIGFAETATAIGTGLAVFAPENSAYIHTTREKFEGLEFLYFNEEHSHATDQMVIKNFLDQVLCENTHIIFAEDEVTTGKTIENFIKVLLKAYPDYQLSFGIASILNGMDEEKLAELKERSIDVNYLLPVPKYDYDSILSEFSYEPSLQYVCKKSHTSYETITIGDYADTRLGVMIEDYVKLCKNFSEKLIEKLSLKDLSEKNILVLGTEEFMFAGIYFGNYLETHTNHKVSFHATTRSPILPSGEDNYPIKKRYQLTSFYEENRTTFLYNLETYDYVLVLTDSKEDTSAMAELCDALAMNNCTNITKITWR